MSRTRRWYEIAVALPIVAVFATYYVYEVVTGPPRDFPAHYLGLAAGLAIPTALWLVASWLVASWLVVRHWWHGTAPLGYAVGLAEAMRRFAIDGTLFDGEVAGGAGEILYESLTFSWVFGPVLAWPFDVLGAALGALNARAS